MRRRTYLVGTALTAGSLAAGVAIAPAASTKPKPKPVAVVCATSVTTQIPPGDTQVVPPVTQGTDYGSVKCGGKLFGRGVQVDRFTVPDSGDTVGSYAQYFGTGSIHGKFDLTPDEAPTTTATTFQATTYTGTVTVGGGTGAYVGAKGTGTAKCQSPDGVHTSCTVRLKLKQL